MKLNEFYIFIMDFNTYPSMSSFLNCISYDTYSIIYISEYNQYSIFINSNCEEKTNVRIYMLTTSTCLLPRDDVEIEEDEEEDEQETTKPTIITSIPKVETTIIYSYTNNNYITNGNYNYS